MKKEVQIEKKLLALSNDIAEYPPMNLSMHEWQALIVLSSVVNSRERPILGIDDVQEIAKERGLVTKKEQNQLLNELIDAQNRYEMTYDEFFNHYDGDTPLTRKTKHDILKAMESLSTKPVITANTDKLFASFNWFDGIINDKENKIIKYFLGQVSKRLLMGLDKNFLQMMARLSIKEAKKYDIPIFVHMKSKLHSKRDIYVSTEPLPKFKERFGHDRIPSYNAWKDYYRRVLTSAEKYSQKSGDIAFKFEGKTTKGRKITHIQYKIWRTGNIHAPNSRKELQEVTRKKERRKQWENIKSNLTVQEIRGFEFLTSMEVNYAFVLEECLQHNCLKHEMINGYEDLFLRLLWKRFSTYTKARKKGGAFVTWWRRGLLTEGDHYWATVETLGKKKKEITQKEEDERKISATMPKTEYQALKQKERTSPDDDKENLKVEIAFEKEDKRSKKFNYEIFKQEFFKEHNQIEKDIFDRVSNLFAAKEGGGEVQKKHLSAIKKQVHQILPQHCEKWYKEYFTKK